MEREITQLSCHHEFGVGTFLFALCSILQDVWLFIRFHLFMDKLYPHPTVTHLEE
jgi:hypothetical protein